MAKLRMQVERMTCAHCERTVEHLLKEAGATEPKADWRRGEATFEFEGDRSSIDESFTASHYRPGEIEHLVAPSPSGEPRGDGDYDLVAIGAGSAAFAAAIGGTNLEARVAIVERNTVGGTCVNVGCIPSKNLLAAAEAYHQAGHHPFAGLSTSQDGVDMAALTGMKSDVVTMLRQEKYLDLAEHYGFDLIKGEARFVDKDAIEVDGRLIRAAKFLISTGAAPWAPPIEGLEGAGYLTSTTAMELKELNKRTPPLSRASRERTDWHFPARTLATTPLDEHARAHQQRAQEAHPRGRDLPNRDSRVRMLATLLLEQDANGRSRIAAASASNPRDGSTASSKEVTRRRNYSQ